MPRPHSRVSAARRRRQILRAATRLFAQRGFRGTTTRRIAERVGMNEAILFRHFPQKDALSWAVIASKCRAAGGREQLERELHSGRNDSKMFAAIAAGALRRNTADNTLSRLLLFSALENHRLSHRFFRTYVADYYEALANHIRRRIRAGAFRRLNPLLAARGFLGMVAYHFLIQELFGGRRYQKFNAERVCQTLADIWLEGMRARGSNHRGRRSSLRTGRRT